MTKVLANDPVFGDPLTTKELFYFALLLDPQMGSLLIIEHLGVKHYIPNNRNAENERKEKFMIYLKGVAEFAGQAFLDSRERFSTSRTDIVSQIENTHSDSSFGKVRKEWRIQVAR